MNPQRCCSDAIDLNAQMGEEDAEILNHVVRAGIAQHCYPGRECRSQQRVLGNRVAAFGQSDGPCRFDRLVHCAVVEAVSGVYVQPKSPEHLQVRLNGAPPDIAPSGVRQFEVWVGAQHRTEEHDHRAGTSCRLEIHLVQ